MLFCLSVRLETRFLSFLFFLNPITLYFSEPLLPLSFYRSRSLAAGIILAIIVLAAIAIGGCCCYYWLRGNKKRQAFMRQKVCCGLIKEPKEDDYAGAAIYNGCVAERSGAFWFCECEGATRAMTPLR